MRIPTFGRDGSVLGGGIHHYLGSKRSEQDKGFRWFQIGFRCGDTVNLWDAGVGLRWFHLTVSDWFQVRWHGELGM